MLKNIIRKIIYKTIELIERYEYRDYSFDESNPLDKIINTITTNGYEVETDYGFVPVTEMNLTSPMSLYRLELVNGDVLECADTHIVFTSGHYQKFVKDLTEFDYVLCRDEKFEGVRVKSVVKMESKVSMLDITVDTREKSYYSGNILSHNTVSAAISILHFALFNTDKGIMIVANKGKTVEEIIDKIKNIYMPLPFFLKAGVVNWNMTTIVFDNGCKLKTEKRSSSPAIGMSIDFLYLDEFAHIPANIIEAYYTAVIPVLSSIDNSRLVITSTPKGMNLFHKLLTGSELAHDDPDWNGFHSLRIYWWQVKGRRDTKIFMNSAKMEKFGIEPQDIKDVLLSYDCVIYDKREDNIPGIFIVYDTNNDKTHYDFVTQLRVKNIPMTEFSRVTNWEKQQTKIIGGEDGFKQEYDLQFLTGNKLLFDSTYIEELYNNKKEFEYVDIPRFNKRLKIPYNGLKFVHNQPSLFNINDVKKYKIFIGVDLAEGLGNDFTVFNIFRLVPKTEEEIKRYKSTFADIYDYFKLEQIGVYKTNVYSVEEVAHVLYMICFEFFDCEHTRVVLERNTYGDTLLAHIPNVFNQDNDYSNHIFLRYKAKQDDKVAKMGIKITRNKMMMVKDYQVITRKGNIQLHDIFTIQEVTTFTRQDTPSGEITFKSESGHDDLIMSTITLSTCFSHVAYHDAVDELILEMGGDLSKIIIDTKDRLDIETPDLSSFSSSYSKVYKNGGNKGGGFGEMMKKQFGNRF